MKLNIEFPKYGLTDKPPSWMKKYSNYTIDWIIYLDPSYLYWILDNTYFRLTDEAMGILTNPKTYASKGAWEDIEWSDFDLL